MELSRFKPLKNNIDKMIYKIQLLPVSTRLETILVSSIGKLIGRNLRSRSGELGTDTNFCNDDGCTKIPNKSSNF
jgi:hypothetical protein